MKRLINLALLLAFQFCYLQWPPNNSMFIFQGEYEIFSKTNHLIDNLTHPIIISGIIAQLFLLLGAIFRNFNQKLNTLGVILLAVLALLFLLVGILSMNFKIITSTFPYLGLAFMYFVKTKRKEF